MSVIYHVKQNWNFKAFKRHLRWHFSRIQIWIFPPIFSSAEEWARYRDLSKSVRRSSGEGLRKKLCQHWALLKKLLLSRLSLAWVERLRLTSTLKLLMNNSWNKWSVNFSISLREHAILLVPKSEDFGREKIQLLAGRRHEKIYKRSKENILGYRQKIQSASPWTFNSLSHHPFLMGWLVNYKF